MSSTGIRGIRRKKSSLSEVKIAVIGAPGVGKSALIVRFLTKRYIGEYDHQSETRYRNEILVDNEPVLFEILDTCPKSMESLPSPDLVQWADGFLLVYSITDRQSFNWIKRCRFHLAERRAGRDRISGNSGGIMNPHHGDSPSDRGATASAETSASVGNLSAVDPNNASSHQCPVALIGNKADMVHLRQVSTEEGEILAKDLECFFSEVTAAEEYIGVTSGFNELCREVQNARKRNKTSLLDRVLGAKANRIYVRGKSDSALPKD